MSKYTENFPNLSTYDFDTIMCQLRQVCGADPSGMINAQFLSRPTTAKDIALLLHITYDLFQSQVELQKQFVELYTFVKDFFENLDLQEEVNNWLNSAYNSGKFIELFEKYLVYVTPQMYGAKGDGVSDDTLSFNKACESNKPVVVPYTENGYLISSPINVKNDFTNHGEIHYSYMSQSGNWGSEILNIEECNNITIKGGILNGNRNISYNKYDPSISNDEYGHGISLKKSNNIIIENIEIMKCQGDGICLESGSEKVDNNQITINNCNLHHNYRQGLSIVGCENCFVNNNKSSNNGRASIDIEPYKDTSSAKNIFITNNLFSSDNGNVLELYCNNENTGKNINIINNILINNSDLNLGTSAFYMSSLSENAIDKIVFKNNAINNSKNGNRSVSSTGLPRAYGEIIFKDNDITGTPDSSRVQITAKKLFIKGNSIPGFLDISCLTCLISDNFIDNTNDTRNPLLNLNGNVFLISGNNINCRSTLFTTGSVTDLVINIINNQISYADNETTLISAGNSKLKLLYMMNHDNFKITENTYLKGENGEIKANLLFKPRFTNLSDSESSPNFAYERGDIVFYSDPIANGYIGRVYDGANFKNFGQIES